MFSWSDKFNFVVQIHTTQSAPILMKYYFVNYLVFENQQLVEKNWTGVPLQSPANTMDFKLLITKLKKKAGNPAAIVIERYKQVSMEEYTSGGFRA